MTALHPMRKRLRHLPSGLIASAVLLVVGVGVGGLLLAVLARAGWAGLLPMGVAIMGGALGWTVAQAVWTWRARIPYVEIDEQ